MNAKIFGFKCVSGGKHTLIAGHVATKDGNVEFSTTFDHTEPEQLRMSLHELSDSISTIMMMERCYHSFQLASQEQRTVKCVSCGFEGKCKHDSSMTFKGEWNQPGTIYECLTCHYKFTYEGEGNQTKPKVPYTGPVESDVRAGEGSSHS